MSNPSLKVEKDGDVWAVVLSEPQSPDFFVVLDRFDTQQHAEDYCFGCVEPILNRVIEMATESLDKQLAVETTERERWQSMVDLIEESHGGQNSFSPVALLAQMIYLKKRLATQEAALKMADEMQKAILPLAHCRGLLEGSIAYFNERFAALTKASSSYDEARKRT